MKYRLYFVHVTHPSGLDSTAPPPPADLVIQLLLDRYSARVQVIECLLFRADFYVESASPGVRAVAVIFEDLAACTAGLLPLSSLSLHQSITC